MDPVQHVVGVDEVWTFSGRGPRGEQVDVLLLGEAHRPLVPPDVFEDARRTRLRDGVCSVLELLHRLRDAWLLLESETLDVNPVVEGARHEETSYLAQLVQNGHARGVLRQLDDLATPTRASLMRLLLTLSEYDDEIGRGWVDDPSPLGTAAMVLSLCDPYTWTITSEQEGRRKRDVAEQLGEPTPPCILHRSVRYVRMDVRTSAALRMDLTEEQVRFLLPILFRAADLRYVRSLTTTRGKLDVLLAMAHRKGGATDWKHYYEAEHLLMHMIDAWLHVPARRRADVQVFLSNQLAARIRGKRATSASGHTELLNGLLVDLFTISNLVRKVERGNGRVVLYAGTNHLKVVQKFLTRTYPTLAQQCSHNPAHRLCDRDADPTPSTLDLHDFYESPAVVTINKQQGTVLQRLCRGRIG